MVCGLGCVEWVVWSLLFVLSWVVTISRAVWIHIGDKSIALHLPGSPNRREKLLNKFRVFYNISPFQEWLLPALGWEI